MAPNLKTVVASAMLLYAANQVYSQSNVNPINLSTNSNDEKLDAPIYQEWNRINDGQDIRKRLDNNQSYSYTNLEAAIESSDDGDFIGNNPTQYSVAIFYVHGTNGELYPCLVGNPIAEGRNEGNMYFARSGMPGNDELKGLEILFDSNKTGFDESSYNHETKIFNGDIDAFNSYVANNSGLEAIYTDRITQNQFFELLESFSERLGYSINILVSENKKSIFTDNYNGTLITAVPDSHQLVSAQPLEGNRTETTGRGTKALIGPFSGQVYVPPARQSSSHNHNNGNDDRDVGQFEHNDDSDDEDNTQDSDLKEDEDPFAGL